jgi:ketosteroid isomerase-like protein
MLKPQSGSNRSSGVTSRRLPTVAGTTSLRCFHPDAILNVAGASPKHGHERLRPFYENIGARFDRYAPTVNRVLTEGTLEHGAAVAILVLNATSRQGEAIEVHTADDFTIEDGRIRTLRIIFDTCLMR